MGWFVAEESLQEGEWVILSMVIDRRRASQDDRVPPTHRAWVEVDLGAIRNNVKAIRQLLSPSTQLMSVVKATPTSAKELARKVRQVVETDAYGLYHIINSGECSWYQSAAAIFELSGIRPRLSQTTTAAYGARATRPAYSVLDNANLRALGPDDLRHWRDALKDYLSDRKQITKEA